MLPKPIIKFNYSIELNAPPEAIFPYLVDAEKIASWQSFAYRDIFAVEARIEYPDPQKELGPGKTFIRHVELEVPERSGRGPAPQGAVPKRRKSDTIHGTIVEYDPPRFIAMKSGNPKMGLFQTVTYDKYTLTPLDHGTRLTIDSEVTLKSEQAEEVRKTATSIFMAIISIPLYVSYLIFKQILAATFYGHLQAITVASLHKLKEKVEGR